MIRNLLILGLLGACIVAIGESFLHYSSRVMMEAEAFQLFKHVSITHLKIGHFISVFGLAFYSAGYLGIYKMLKSGHENLARTVLILSFIAFSIGGIWIGSRAMVGNLVHMQENFDPISYKLLMEMYDTHYEILVQILRIVIVLLSLIFSTTIIIYPTSFKKWMALFNPFLILIIILLIGLALPELGKFVIPALMNITHIIFFSLAIFQTNVSLK